MNEVKKIAEQHKQDISAVEGGRSLEEKESALLTKYVFLNRK